MWAFDDKINKNVIFIAHTDINHDSHLILSYQVENTNYPERLGNGGKILQMYPKTCESKCIDSCCIMLMSLSKLGDTFNLPDEVKHTLPHCFNTNDYYGYVSQIPAYESNGLNEPAGSKLIEWHDEYSNDEYICDCEIQEYCTADVAL